MYLDYFKNCGKPYLRILQNYYNNINGKVKITRKTIKNLGPLSKYDDNKPDLILRLREQFKKGELISLETLQIPTKDENQKISISEINFKLAPKNLGYIFLNQIYNELGIDIILNRIKSDSKITYDLNGIMKLLVFGRILTPQSKKKTFEKKDKYLFPVTTCKDLNEVYKALTVLKENSKKNTK